MQFKPGSIPFNSFRDSGPREESTDVPLDADASQATAIMTGFVAGYSPSDNDHHLGNLEVRLRTEILAPRLVRVTAVFGLRDWSGDWDDRYDGIVDFVVLAE